MYYEIYLDRLFLVNFVMNLFCLGLTDLTYLKTASRRRIIAGAALGGALSLLPFLLPGRAWWKMAAGFLASMAGMIPVTFRTSGFRAFWQALQRLFLCSFLLGGGLLFLVGRLPKFRRFLTSMMGVLGIAALLFMEISYLVEKNGERRDLCRVRLKGNGRTVEVGALVDSGNSLVEPVSGKPVCVLQKSVFDRLWEGASPEGFRLIPYHSVGRPHGMLSGYLIPEMEIEWQGTVRNRRNVYVGLCEEPVSGGEGVEMLLHPMVLKEESIA